MTQRAATPADRLRLLRDCGVVRASVQDRGFQTLCRRGWAEKRSFGNRWMCDYLLTEQGRREAAWLKPFE